MPPLKIAIIGSGIAGLAAAHWLQQEKDVRVTLFEQSDNLGMDCHRVDLEMGDDRVSVDVPSRMFNTAQWPNLVDLYDQIGVAYDPVDACQSFTKRWASAVDATDDTYLKFDVAFRPDLALRQMLKSKPRAILSEAARLMNEGRRDLDKGINRAQTLGEYLADNEYTTSFKKEFLYPTLSSTVCTCSYASLDSYPAHIILGTLRCLTDDRALLRTRHGTRDVVTRLASDLADVRTNHPVKSLVDNGDNVTISSAGGSIENFDHVIVATQANTALSLQPDIPYFERELLASIPYQDIDVVVHTDARLMPSRQADWRTFNMIVHETDANETIDAAMCTVWLNRFDAALPSTAERLSNHWSVARTFVHERRRSDQVATAGCQRTIDAWTGNTGRPA